MSAACSHLLYSRLVRVCLGPSAIAAHKLLCGNPLVVLGVQVLHYDIIFAFSLVLFIYKGFPVKYRCYLLAGRSQSREMAPQASRNLKDRNDMCR